MSEFDGDPPSGSADALADADLTALADETWDTAMRSSPLTATTLGDPRFHGLLADNRPSGLTATGDRLRALRHRAVGLPADRLDREGLITRSALVSFLDAKIAELVPTLAEWSVDPMVGPQVSLLTIGAEQPVADTGQRRAAAERWRLMAGYVDQHAANLRSAAGEGRVAAACLVRKVIGQLDDLLATPPSESPLLDPARRASAAGAAADATRFGSDLEQAVLEGVMPAFARLRTVLAEQILPRARLDDEAGISFLPDGQTLYRQAIRGFTTLDVDPETVHLTGRSEVERNDAELAELASSELGTTDLATALDRLRNGTDLGFDSREEMLTAARATVARAEAAVPDWFGLRQEAPCEVIPTPPHEEAHSPPAQYRLAAEDGSRPGRFWITTSEPRSRPRFLLEVQCFHEAVPGHHLQLGVAAQLTGLPAFRRRAIVPAYAEGWGLYAEHLAGDMGLYSTRQDRLGARSQDALRSCRLVVDTGLHAFGWSRWRAIDYLLSHTALSERAAAAEVDRYLAWPGQALAYKLGQLELLDLRRRSAQHLGDRFDVRRFHDVVLSHGSLPLAVVREIVQEELGLDRSGPGHAAPTATL
jgi:uncharacterized protein (DUF885 family)